MIWRRTTSIMIAAIAAFSASTASADELGLEVGILIGFADHQKGTTLGSEQAQVRNEALSGLRAGLLLGDHLALEAEARLGSMTLSGFDVPLTTLGLRGQVTVSLLKGDLTPILFYGLGADRLLTGDTGFDGGNVLGVDHLGAGLKWRYDEGLGARFDARWSLIARDNTPLTGLAEIGGTLYMAF